MPRGQSIHKVTWLRINGVFAVTKWMNSQLIWSLLNDTGMFQWQFKLLVSVSSAHGNTVTFCSHIIQWLKVLPYRWHGLMKKPKSKTRSVWRGVFVRGMRGWWRCETTILKCFLRIETENLYPVAGETDLGGKFIRRLPKQTKSNTPKAFWDRLG